MKKETEGELIVWGIRLFFMVILVGTFWLLTLIF